MLKKIRVIFNMLASMSIIFGATGSMAMSDAELKQTTATIINLNRLLCAQVVDIKPLKVRPNHYEVTCIEYRGGSGTVRYIMDASTAKAWRP